MEVIKPEGLADLLSILKSHSFVDPTITRTVLDIIEEVKSRGDEALIEFTRRFDRWDPSNGFEATEGDLEKAWASLEDDVKRALLKAKERIEVYHRQQIEKSWFFEEGKSLLGMLIRPVDRVGVYVPGGRAAYPSTVLMNVIPAKVAGVPEVIMCVPTPDGCKNPYVLGAAYIAGVDRVFFVGGAQAVAAMAYGTNTVSKVDKIVGPGNIYVAEAKRLVYGEVDIDSIAGPSEVLVIADGTVSAEWVAADLLSQAEHDPMARSILISLSKDYALEVLSEVEKQLVKLPTKEVAEESWRNNGVVVIAKDIDEACEVANAIAPEHLELLVESPWEVVPKLKNAGAIFVGGYSPEPIGDYIAGPNHTLPTGGRARFSSPLGVYHFYKRTSLIAIDGELFLDLAYDAMKIAEVEGLIAHKRSIEKRVEGEE
ncbi:histidinol dehydrogenase [Thermosulfidibacter takaii ABI70S6]|uniref:Histidinol dehydrogenase n=1 Tax=Thermosulfidibacter takaii (strain DSM 17441 / JCM 13301 / NBRC 103674 / ABI70S6) TaxID=1298851 RepID=A0A0S3QS10_THET7|nr:histidinol dehydrogenase [Thermosulfidibacter takaii]BAT71109.1 histidinol dehydrogenase [Thermosulfidibacter takaii ABI70S6]